MRFSPSIPFKPCHVTFSLPQACHSLRAHRLLLSISLIDHQQHDRTYRRRAFGESGTIEGCSSSTFKWWEDTVCARRLAVCLMLTFTRYPKHVWSPAGGWYAQPANWKSNTAIMLVIIVGITAAAGKWGAEHEQWHRMPDPNRFTPSR